MLMGLQKSEKATVFLCLLVILLFVAPLFVLGEDAIFVSMIISIPISPGTRCLREIQGNYSVPSMRASHGIINRLPR